MTRFSIDPPTFLRVARHEERPHRDHQLVAPNSLRSRALALLLREVRAGELDDGQALQIHEQLTELKVRLLGDRVSRRTAWTYAREFDWEDLEDAECLAVTRLQADALITVDPRLAAKAAGVVPLATFEDLFSG
jgi:predicted nucleic acid-binding protein